MRVARAPGAARLGAATAAPRTESPGQQRQACPALPPRLSPASSGGGIGRERLEPRSRNRRPPVWRGLQRGAPVARQLTPNPAALREALLTPQIKLKLFRSLRRALRAWHYDVLTLNLVAPCLRRCPSRGGTRINARAAFTEIAARLSTASRDASPSSPLPPPDLSHLLLASNPS
ncbi:unnamed protein product [Lampetra fluviatilis]